MKNAKRFLSTLLALVMVLSVLPMSVLAAKIELDDGLAAELLFGQPVKPNAVLDADKYLYGGKSVYDIRAVGGVEVSAVENGNNGYKMQAKGILQLCIPMAEIEAMINTMVDEKLGGLVGSATSEFQGTVSDGLSEPQQQTIAGVSYELNFAQIIYKICEKVSNVNTRATLIDEAAKKAASVMGTYIPTANSNPETFAYKNWLAAAKNVGTPAQAEACAKQFATALALKKLKDLAGKEWDANMGISSTVHSLLGIALTGINYTEGEKPNVFYRAAEQIEEELGLIEGKDGKVLSNIKGHLQGEIEKVLYVDDDAVAKVLYGELLPDYGDTLSGRIEVVNAKVESFKTYAEKFGATFTFTLPTDQIVKLEGTLQEVVKAINGEDDPGYVYGRICGATTEATDKIDSEISNVGMYVVAGVDYFGRITDEEDENYSEAYLNNYKEKVFEPYVVTPGAKTITIMADGEKAGPYIHTDVNNIPVITAADADLYFCGVNTKGELHKVDEGVPTLPGVYTVFAIHLDDAELTIGGAVSILVIEPEAADFGFDAEDENYVGNNKFEFEEDGTQYFPATDGTDSAVKVAVKDDEVYVKIPSNVAELAGVTVDKVGDSYETIEDKLAEDYSLVLPQRLTAMVTKVLSKLEAAADKGDDTAEVSREEVRDLLLDYLAKVEGKIAEETEGKTFEAVLESEFTAAVDTVKAKIAGSDTVKNYSSMISSVIEKFKALMQGQQTFSSKAIPSTGNTTLDKILEQFLDKAMSEIKANKDTALELMEFIVSYVEESSYMQDAETLIKTLGEIGGLSAAEIKTHVDNVKGYAATLKGVVEGEAAEIANGEIPNKADAKKVLSAVKTFSKAVVAEAKVVVGKYDVGMIYFNILPSEAGVYDCYAVNVSSNSMPKLVDTTMEIKAAVAPVPEYAFGQTSQIWLIEPWALRANLKVYHENEGVRGAQLTYAELEQLDDFGVYFVRESDLGIADATQNNVTKEDIINNANVVNKTKASGDVSIAIDNTGADKYMISCDFDEGIYTYEMSDSVFVMYYVVSDGVTYYAPIRERNLSSMLNQYKDDATAFPDEKERAVYEKMAELEVKTLAYRSNWDDPQPLPITVGTPVKNYDLGTEKAHTIGFGHTTQVVLIEPWGLGFNAFVTSDETYADYGVVVYYDTDNTASITTVDELLAQDGAVVLSTYNGEATVAEQGDGREKISAVHNKGVYTYQMQKSAYVAFFVKDALGNTYYGPLKVRTISQTIDNTVVDESVELGRLQKALLDSMNDLYDVVKAYRASKGFNDI